VKNKDDRPNFRLSKLLLGYAMRKHECKRLFAVGHKTKHGFVFYLGYILNWFLVQSAFENFCHESCFLVVVMDAHE